WEDQGRPTFPAAAQDDERAPAAYHRPHHCRAPSTLACQRGGTGHMAGGGAARGVRLLRRAHEWARYRFPPPSRHLCMAYPSHEAEPKGKGHLGTDGRACPEMAATHSHPPSLSNAALVHRQPAKVGAGCVNCACPDLCGGWAARPIPTATRGSPAILRI